MGSNIIFRRLSLIAENGWVPLSSAPVIADVQFHAVNTALISARWKGEPSGGVLLGSNIVYMLKQVDLSALEFSTTSGTPVFLLSIAQAPAEARI